MATGQVLIPSSCDICDSYQNVTSYCVKCSEKLCDTCAVNHRKGRKTRNDEIVSLDEGLSGKHTSPVYTSCRSHPSKSCETHCKTCHKDVCSQCIIKDHNGHELMSIEDIPKSQNDKLFGHIDTLKKEIVRCEQLVSSSDSSYSTFNGNISNLRTEVTNKYSEIVKYLTASRDQCLKDINNIQTSDHQKYSDCKKQLSNKIKHAKTIVLDSEDRSVHTDRENVSSLINEIEMVNKLPSILVYIPSQCTFIPGNNVQSDVDSMFGCIIKSNDSTKRKGVIDVDKLKVNTIRTPQNTGINTVIPARNNYIWVGYGCETYLRRIDDTGKEVSQSDDIGRITADGDTLSSGDLVVSLDWGQEIQRLNNEGRDVKTLVNISPLFTMAVSVTSKDEVLVALKSTRYTLDKDTQIHRYTLTGHILQKITNSTHIGLSLSRPFSIASLSQSGIVVVDQDPHRVIKMDGGGQHITTWREEDIDKNNKYMYRIRGITSDDDDNIYVCDYGSSNIYMIHNNGHIKSILNTKNGIQNPSRIKMKNGIMYIVCSNGDVHIVT